MRRLTSIALLSSLLLFSGCQEDLPVTEDIVMDCNLAGIDSVSDPSGTGLRTIVITMSDKEGNSLTITAGSGMKHLEAGYYTLSGTVDERMEASAVLTLNGEKFEDVQGTMYVRKRNHDYDIECNLATEGGKVRCMADGKKLFFETCTHESVTGNGKGTELKDLALESRIMNATMKYSVYLPEGYDEGKEYPVLYILHGMDGDNNDWLDSGRIDAYASAMAESGEAREMVIICPDGGNYFYCNDIGAPYMSYFFEEFIPFVESEYAIRQDKYSRAIGGLSMGGYGSLYYGLLHPEMFCHVYACSPAVNLGGIYPDLCRMLSSLSASDSIAGLPGITIEIGTEDFLYTLNQAFVKTLDSYNTAYEYITRSGAHTWPFWKECSPKIIHKASISFK